MEQNRKQIIAIGALGGSGTRVVAEILKSIGIFIGDELNLPNDNLLFTRLFKDNKWYKKSSERSKRRRLRVFQKKMESQSLSFFEKIELFRAAYNNKLFKTNRRYLVDIFLKKETRKDNFDKTWAWKEPNSIIYLEEIVSFFPNIKFIYVIRHGLDMAFSKNKQQLHNWGFLYDCEVSINDSEKEIYVKQLKYWINTSKKTIKKGKELLGDNFYVLNHQLLCENPKDEVQKLIDFMELEITDNKFNEISQLPVIPKTNKRYLKQDLSVFSKKQIEEVIKLGFEI